MAKLLTLLHAATGRVRVAETGSFRRKFDETVRRSALIWLI